MDKTYWLKEKIDGCPNLKIGDRLVRIHGISFYVNDDMDAIVYIPKEALDKYFTDQDPLETQPKPSPTIIDGWTVNDGVNLPGNVKIVWVSILKNNLRRLQQGYSICGEWFVEGDRVAKGIVEAWMSVSGQYAPDPLKESPFKEAETEPAKETVNKTIKSITNWLKYMSDSDKNAMDDLLKPAAPLMPGCVTSLGGTTSIGISSVPNPFGKKFTYEDFEKVWGDLEMGKPYFKTGLAPEIKTIKNIKFLVSELNTQIAEAHKLGMTVSIEKVENQKDEDDKLVAKITKTIEY